MLFDSENKYKLLYYIKVMKKLNLNILEIMDYKFGRKLFYLFIFYFYTACTSKHNKSISYIKR